MGTTGLVRWFWQEILFHTFIENWKINCFSPITLYEFFCTSTEYLHSESVLRKVQVYLCKTLCRAGIWLFLALSLCRLWKLLCALLISFSICDCLAWMRFLSFISKNFFYFKWCSLRLLTGTSALPRITFIFNLINMVILRWRRNIFGIWPTWAVSSMFRVVSR